MAMTLALLAIDQEEQERVYKHIMNTVGLRDLVSKLRISVGIFVIYAVLQNYEDYKELFPVLHCLHEALRLYRMYSRFLLVTLNAASLTITRTAPAPVVTRVTSENCSLVAPSLTPGSDTLFLPRDTEIMLDFIPSGLNQRTFDNPTRFYPLRWSTSDLSADDLPSFGSGPRGCLGRKFSTVESVCFLTHLLRDWKFTIKLEKNETPLEWHERVVRPYVGVTMKIGQCTND